MGSYLNESDFHQLEIPAYQQLYLNGGPFPTAEGQVTIQAGSALGGGTVVNWTNCLRTHAWVREEWARFGLEGLDGPDYDRHLDAVTERLGATDACSDLNGNHARLREGCEALYDFRLTTRNTDPAATTRRRRDSWATATSRARSGAPRRPTSPTPRRTAPSWLPTAASSGSLSRAVGRRGWRGPTWAPVAAPRG